MRKINFLFVLSAFLYLCIGILSPTIAQKKYASLQEAMGASRQLAGGSGLSNINWINEGEQISFIDKQNIKAMSPKTQKEEILFDGDKATFEGKPFKYQTFQFSKDSKYLLFQENYRPIWRRSGISDYYFYSIADKTIKLVAKDAQTAELSPDGSKIGYEKGGDMYVFDFVTQKETRLTNDAKEFFYNGRFGWVYEEEFGLAQAWAWSPDSKQIAFWQSDEREVPTFQMTGYQDQKEVYEKLPYPQVGDKNPTVKIGVVEIATSQKQFMNVDLGDGYIPRIYWTSQAGQLALVHLNRKQNHLKLYFCDAKTGTAKQILEEKTENWIDIFDFFAGVIDYFFFPVGNKEFFWISERDGFAHIYRYDYTGKLINQVTKGNWEVVSMHSIDTKNNKLYYISTEKSPMERQLYEISLDGKNKKQLTQADGRHRINFSPNGKYYTDSYSNISTPRQMELWETGKTMLKKIESNEKVKEFIKSNNYAPKELMNFTTSDGQKIDIHVIKPIGFDANKKYPVLLNIYGGPGAQSVYNEFARDGWEQYLAQEGYVIVSVNNRGSGGYGNKFEKIVYEQLGKYESKDFAETAQFMAKMPWVDGEKIGIRGHSYGGYMSSFTILNYPNIFKVALVGAPVTDWRLYDSAYTERYMGLLPENNEKYKASASTTYAKNLKGKMLIAHSTMDENVHVKNTFQLVTNLIDNGKDVDLKIYPMGAHGVAYDAVSNLLLFTQYTNYLNKHLK
jgi:dipeptidyl-peptidase 4